MGKNYIKKDVLVTEEMHAKILQIMAEEDIKFSVWVRKLIRKELEKYK